MNAVAANTLLKTLEEPAGDARFVLSSAAPDALLPTIRSRCQALPLLAPAREQALAWLAGKGVEGPEVLLGATGGQPLEALDWAQQGLNAELWLRLPQLVAGGESAALANWPLPRLIDALQKLSHDALCTAVGAMPRYFPALSLGRGASLPALLEWTRSLARTARYAEHPWQPALMTESLLQQARASLLPTGSADRAKPVDSLHSST
jgi:DNA polymerase-3 subunit delta'